jgi:hypothetical protein
LIISLITHIINLLITPITLIHGTLDLNTRSLVHFMYLPSSMFPLT